MQGQEGAQERRGRPVLQLLAVVFTVSLLFDLLPAGGSQKRDDGPSAPKSPGEAPKPDPKAASRIAAELSHAMRESRDRGAVYPANITSFLQGSWEIRSGRATPAGARDAVAARLLNFRWPSLPPASFPLKDSKGASLLQLFSRPSAVPGIHVIQGFVAIRGDRQRSSQDEVFLAKGLYFRSFGRLTLFANTKGSRLGVAWGFHETTKKGPNGTSTVVSFNSTAVTTLLPSWQNGQPRRMLRAARVPEAQGDALAGGDSASEGTPSEQQSPSTAQEKVPSSVTVTSASPGAPDAGLDVDGFLEQQVAQGAGEEAIMRAAQSLEEEAEGAAALGAHPRRGLVNKPACAYLLRLAVDPVAKRPPHLGGDGSKKPDEAGDGEVEGAGQVQSLRVHGVAVSPNCGALMNITAEGVRAAPSYLSAKANSYATIAILTSAMQLVAQGVQMSRSSTQSMAQRVSTASVGVLAIIDSYLCLIHLTIGVMRADIFATFATTAFLEMLLFSVFGMRLLLMAWKAQNPEAFSSGIDVLRRRLGGLYARFYCSMILGMVILYNFASYDFFVPIIAFASVSFFLPQIVFSARFNYRHALHPAYILVMGSTRLFIPLYLLACPSSLPHVLLGTALRPGLAEAISAYVALQILLLLSQSRLKPRWFLPRSLLPEMYNYERRIPPELRRRLARGEQPGVPPPPDAEGGTVAEPSAEPAAAPSASAPEPAPVPTQSGDSGHWLTQLPSALRGARARMAGYASVPTSASQRGARAHADGGEGGEGAEGLDIEEGGVVATTCVICMDRLRVVRGEYMVTPCDHVFHKACLQQWMAVKLECPTCRAVLPPHEDDEGIM